MIVTCPGCASKYRVKNETVPPEGAKMRCPKCETLFLAKLPAGGGPVDDDGAFQAAVGAATGAFAVPPPAPPQSTATPSPPVAAPALFATAPVAMPAPSVGAAQAYTPGALFGATPPSSGITQRAGDPFAFAAPPPTSPGARAPGPLTQMMGAVDEQALRAALQPPPPAVGAPAVPRPARAPDDDPFAKLELDNRPAHAQVLPQTPRVEPPRPRPAPSPAASTTTRAAQVPGPREPLAQQVASWGGLAAAAIACVCGSLFAGWTSEALDLDDSAMPMFERTFGVEPPCSLIGAGDVDVEILRRAAQDAESAGDLAASAVLWRRVQARDAADRAAATALPRVLTALGEKPTN